MEKIIEIHKESKSSLGAKRQNLIRYFDSSRNLVSPDIVVLLFFNYRMLSIFTNTKIRFINQA